MSKLTTLRHRAVELVLANEWDQEALQVNEQILVIVQDDIDSLLRLAKCHETLGSLQKAQELYQRVLALQPGKQIAENGLERIEPKLRQVSQLEGLRKIRSYGQAFAIAQDAKRRSDLNQEIAALLRACELERRPQALTMLAAAYRHNQRWTEAERLYNEALTLQTIQ